MSRPLLSKHLRATLYQLLDGFARLWLRLRALTAAMIVRLLGMRVIVRLSALVVNHLHKGFGFIESGCSVREALVFVRGQSSCHNRWRIHSSVCDAHLGVS